MRHLLISVLIGIPFVLIGQQYGFQADYLFHIRPDGRSYDMYLRTESKNNFSYQVISRGADPHEVFNFTTPRDYEIVRDSTLGFDYIHFDRGNFSLGVTDYLGEEYVTEEDGVYTYRSTMKKNSQGNYGFYASTYFEELNFVWIIPDNMEYVNYNCLTKGDFALTKNTLSWVGQGVNNVVFEIEYRIKPDVPKEVKERELVVADSITLKGKELKFSIWDDSKIDNDIVSVSLNGEWILRNIRAPAQPLEVSYTLPFKENVLVIYAENIGEIPPNTTAIEIREGNNVLVRTLNCDLGKSEGILIRRE